MKKIILVILGMFLLGFVLNEITGAKFPIGSTTLHDSTSVFTINNNVKINGTSQSNGRVLESGETVRQKIIKGKLSATTGSFNYFTHGVADYRQIISVDWYVVDDSLSYAIAPGYNLIAGLATGNNLIVRSSDISYYLLPGAVSLKSDTIKMLLTYRK